MIERVSCDFPGGSARLRIALALVSMAALALQWCLMRLLSTRFWHSAAYLVISVALLGFGASGTALTFFRHRIARAPARWVAGLALAFGVATITAARLAARLPLEVRFLAWDPRQARGIVALELLTFVPFLLAGGCIGAALMDRPKRVGGHYAANLIGSGAGSIAAVVWLHGLYAEHLVIVLSFLGIVAGALVMPWRRRPGWATLGIVAAAAWVGLAGFWGRRPVYSAYKRITFETAAGATILHEAPGSLGRLTVLEGPSIHEHPGLGWEYTGPIPPHVLLLINGETVSAVYDAQTRREWAFLDHTTAAVAYVLTDRPAVCVAGMGGGAGMGLAQAHDASRITALEPNLRVIETLRGPLRDRGGAIVRAPGVTVLNRSVRGHFARSGERYDLIQVPPLDTFGAGGLFATQESYLHTVESYTQMMNRLNSGGVLAVTLWMQDPPREGLRAFETLADAFRRRGLDPARRLALIRSRTTVTVCARPDGWDEENVDAIRRFCAERGFDLGYVPGLRPEETNRFHGLSQPTEAAVVKALLGPDRNAFLRRYLFALEAATDDRPFFFHTFRWRTLGEIQRQLGGRTRAFLEPGYLMLLAAFGQAFLLAFLFVLFPLILRRRRPPVRGFALLYFFLLGLGFMMLEMALIGRLILYLAEPIYAAAAAVAGFLVWAGVGSRLGNRWRIGDRALIARMGGAASVLAVLYALGLGSWLEVTQAAPMGFRFFLAWVTIAPLGLAMGHLFPAGLRLLARQAPDGVPWAWAVNGFASVLASVGTGFLAMQIGYERVGLVAAACYGLAAWLGARVFEP